VKRGRVHERLETGQLDRGQPHKEFCSPAPPFRKNWQSVAAGDIEVLFMK
jgi:hypothetical protein